MGFGDSFMKFKTRAAQTIGKSQAREEPPEFHDMVALYKGTKRDIEDILDVTKKLHSNMCKTADSYEACATILAKVDSKDNRKNLVAIVPMFSKDGKAEQEMANGFKINVIDCLTNIKDIQIKACERALKVVDDSRLDLDAKEARFRSMLDSSKNSQTEVDVQKRKCDDAENVYNSAKDALQEACRQLEIAKNDFYQEKFANIAGCFGECGATFANNAQAYIDETQ